MSHPTPWPAPARGGGTDGASWRHTRSMCRQDAPFPICITLRLSAGVWGASKECLWRTRCCQQSWQHLVRQSDFFRAAALKGGELIAPLETDKATHAGDFICFSTLFINTAKRRCYRTMLIATFYFSCETSTYTAQEHAAKALRYQCTCSTAAWFTPSARRTTSLRCCRSTGLAT